MVLVWEALIHFHCLFKKLVVLMPTLNIFSRGAKNGTRPFK